MTIIAATRLMPTTAAELCTVDLIAEATPRLSTGTDRIIELMFGTAKSPSPTPTKARIIAISQYGDAAETDEKRKRLAPRMPMPAVVRPLEPCRSEDRLSQTRLYVSARASKTGF